MTTLPQLKNLPQESLKNVHTYKKLSMDGKLVEQWELVDGEWRDVTEIMKAKEEIANAQEELERTLADERKMKLAIERAKQGLPSNNIKCPVCGSGLITLVQDYPHKYLCEDCRKRF